MDELKFVSLLEVKEKDIIKLMNDEKVKAQMPLLAKGFSSTDCKNFLITKKNLWDEYGYGPWAILINGNFSGWGGLQPEHGEADFALVLFSQYWGWGRRIFNRVKDWGFNEKELDSITVLLPPSRKNFNAILRLGFTPDGELGLNGQSFLRFRLKKESQRG